MTCIVGHVDNCVSIQYVYVLRNLIDNKVYVGRTHKPNGRYRNHLSLARRGCARYLYRAMRIHGEENFTFEIIESCTDDVIAEREEYWVKHFDSFNPKKGYNLTSGGEGVRNYLHSEKTRQRIKQARARQIITDEHKRRISQGLLRTSQTEEVKEIRRKGQVNRPPCSNETRIKRSNSLRGRLKRCSLCQRTDHNKRTCENRS